MKYIDLHVHSNCSDGTLSPSKLVGLAAKKGLAAIALTDHDTIQGVEEALQAAQQNTQMGHTIRVIPGVEISAGYLSRDIHILGLFVDYTEEHFCLALTKALADRDLRNDQMIENLRKAGIDISKEALTFDEPNTVITRAHFARYLTTKGYASNNNDAFTTYLGYHTPYYVQRKFMESQQAISLILHAKGIPVLAHPLLYKYTLEEIDTMIALLKQQGLIGIETFYSANTGSDEAIIRRFAEKYKLLMTGGSDFHGSNKPYLEIGTGKGNLNIPYSIVEHLEAYLQQTCQ